MILGAINSIPILSLQVESHVQPLALCRDFLTVREYIRMMYRPIDDYTIKILGILNGYHRETAEPFNSFIYRTRKIM